MGDWVPSKHGKMSKPQIPFGDVVTLTAELATRHLVKILHQHQVAAVRFIELRKEDESAIR